MGERADGSRAGNRLLERVEEDCVERGYLLIPVWLEQMGHGDYEAAQTTAAEAAEIGERFGDRDLLWLARDDQGCALVRQGRVADGLRLVDEVLVAATAGELSPIVTGIVYCNTIAFCRDAYELRHAREWTEALTRWCDAQPEMVAHNGLCLVHRAEIMQFRGAWADALEEARRAAARFTRGCSISSPAARPTTERARSIACGESSTPRRMPTGRRAGAASSRSRAWRCCDLAQGHGDAAAAAIRRAVGETTQPLKRAALLPAYVEIMLAVGEHERASAGCRELEELAERQASDALRAMAAHAQGAVALAEGDAEGALVALRRAFALWQRARRALRGRPGAGADGVCLPGARRRGHRDAGAGGRSRGVRRTQSGAGSRLDRLARTAPRPRRSPWAHGAGGSRCCDWSPPGRPTARSPPSW